MTVGQMLRLLVTIAEQYGIETEVWLSSDSEGNVYSPMDDECFVGWARDDDVTSDDDINWDIDDKEDYVRAAVFYPE